MNFKKPDNIICKCIHGSRLYGTNSETSDYDYKVLYLPKIDNLLLGKSGALAVSKERPQGISSNDAMPENLPEIEYIPLQKFAYDFFDGQTYAIELAFALKQGGFATIDNELLLPFIDQLISQFLTSDVSKMVGYSMHQAQVYGLKGERLKALEAVYYALLNEIQENPAAGDIRLSDYKELLRPLCNENIIFTVISGKNPEVNGKECIQINDKQFEWSCPLHYFIESLQKIMKQYGSRTREASKDNVDWKALSHAVRIAHQASALLETGNIIFPIGIAGICRTIKSGQLSYETSINLFSDLSTELERIRKHPSVLPEKTPQLIEDFDAFMLSWITYFYDLN